MEQEPSSQGGVGEEAQLLNVHFMYQTLLCCAGHANLVLRVPCRPHFTEIIAIISPDLGMTLFIL